MRTKEEIIDAVMKVSDNRELSYGYRYDVESILRWVLGGEPFDGLSEKDNDNDNDI